MDYIGTKNWALFSKVLRDAKNTFSKKTIEFIRYPRELNRYREDPVQATPVITLVEVLLNYNYMRTWPITQSSLSGEIDRQSIQIFFNKVYLKELGLLTVNNNLDYDPSMDRFIIDGIKYKAVGDTAASQAPNDDIHYLVIVKREENITTDYNIR